MNLDTHPLTQRLTAARLTFREQARKLRRARRLYIGFCARSISSDQTGDTLNYCAQRMIKVGMYAPIQSMKNARFAILRAMWKRDGGENSLHSPNSWYRWIDRNNWQPFTFDRAQRKVA